MRSKDVQHAQLQVLNEINEKLGLILAILQQQIETPAGPAKAQKAVSKKATEKRS